jgi:hypothetical protein
MNNILIKLNFFYLCILSTMSQITDDYFEVSADGKWLKIDKLLESNLSQYNKRCINNITYWYMTNKWTGYQLNKCLLEKGITSYGTAYVKIYKSIWVKLASTISSDIKPIKLPLMKEAPKYEKGDSGCVYSEDDYSSGSDDEYATGSDSDD